MCVRVRACVRVCTCVCVCFGDWGRQTEALHVFYFSRSLLTVDTTPTVQLSEDTWEKCGSHLGDNDAERRRSIGTLLKEQNKA